MIMCRWSAKVVRCPDPLRPRSVAQRLGRHHERVHRDHGPPSPGSVGVQASVARTTTSAWTVPPAVATGPAAGVPGRMSVTVGVLEERTPGRSTASASPRASSAGCKAAQCGRIGGAEDPGRPDQGYGLLGVEPAQVVLAEAELPLLVQLSPGPGQLGLAAHQVDGAALGELAVDALDGGRAPTTSTVSCMARRMASIDSRPCRRASAASEVANRAEHHPPLRPTAPKPATRVRGRRSAGRDPPG